MRFSFDHRGRRAPFIGGAFALTLCIGLAAVGHVLAGSRAGDAQRDGAPPQRPPAKTAGGPADGRPAFSAQLERAGAATCRAPLDALAAATMAGVESFNTVSNWAQAAGDSRAVSLAIGQRYAAGSTVPFGVSQIIAAPNRRGGCDGFTVQVLPSPLTCAKLRDAIAARQGRLIGDLAGVALMQDARARTMLVPTAAGACVMVATTSVYAD